MTRSRLHFRSEAISHIFDRVVEEGWRWRQGGDHVVVYPPDPTMQPLILSGSAYDGPGTKTTEGQFRRAGMKL